MFVSHNLEHIRNICDRILLLDAGRVVFEGRPLEGIEQYHALTHQKKLATSSKMAKSIVLGQVESGEITFIDAGIMDVGGNGTRKVPFGRDILVFVDFQSNIRIDKAQFSVAVLNESHVNCLRWINTDTEEGHEIMVPEGKHRLTVRFKSPNLSPGIYSLFFSVRNGTSGETYERSHIGDSFVVEGNMIPRAVTSVHVDWDLYHLGT